MDVELGRIESELHHEEAALHGELQRLALVARELEGRLAALRQGKDEEIARRARVEVPPVDADAPFAATRAARQAAVKARQDAVAKARQLVQAARAQLATLTQQAAADEALALARAAEAEQKARAAAEAAAKAAAKAAAAPPAPPPIPPRLEAPPSVASAPPAEARPARGKQRVRMQAAVDINSDDNFFNGFSSNISDGGLFVATVNLLPLGTEIDLAFTLPSGERIEAKGVVRWVREVNDQHPEAFPGMGVQFAGLKPEAQAAIERFLAEREPLFYAD